MRRPEKATDTTDADGAQAGKIRRLGGPVGFLFRLLLVSLAAIGAIWALQLQHYLNVAPFREQYLALMLGLGLVATFIGIKAVPGERGDRVPYYDWLLVAASLAGLGFVVVQYPTMSYSLATTTADRVILGWLTIGLILEATRRLLGWALVIIGLVFCAYAKYADILPGLLYAKNASWDRLGTYLYLDSNAIFGVALAVTATIVIPFILFGQSLQTVRGDRFFTGVALAALGRYRGGTAKVAVVSSSLFGMVSGSVVSNVVTSGAVTIPMMKRAGHSATLAAGIEAVASTGGQIMPPVMGVAAFIIAEYLDVPYSEVAIAAFIPAVLYFTSLFIQIDLESAKLGLKGLDRAQIPRLMEVMRRGWVFVLPFAVLIYTLLIAYWPPGMAGIAAVISVFVFGAIFRESRASLSRILACFEKTGESLLYIIVISALAGIIIGSLQLSGLSFKLSLILTSLADSSLLLLLPLTAIVCVVLGLGMPTTVIYVLLAVLVAPALIELGVRPMAAHMFIFYFGMLSMITPPVCIATYTAASLAKADFWKAGWLGMRLGVMAYIIPFIFVFHPALLAEGSWLDILLATVTALIGVASIAVACVGYLSGRCHVTVRLVALLAGVTVLVPPSNSVLIVANVAGVLCAAGVFLWQLRIGRAD